MSRTKRNYGTYYLDCHGLAAFEYGWIGRGINCDVDPRDALIHGYDGISPSYYYDNYGSKWAGKENYQGKTRKFFKRRYHKRRRRLRIEME